MVKRKEIKRNPMAKALASPLFRNRIVQARKGKGSYTRRDKAGPREGVSS